jgi:glucoamylase
MISLVFYFLSILDISILNHLTFFTVSKKSGDVVKQYIYFLAILISFNSYATQAPGFPGISPTWSSAKKVQIGSSFYDYKDRPRSTTWFSLAQGVLTESYFPTIDKAQIKDSQIIIVTKDGSVIDEKKLMIHEVEVLGPSLVKLINKTEDNKFEIHHTFYTADSSNIIIDEVEVVANEDDAHFYLLTNSALNNSGLNDSALVDGQSLMFYEGSLELNVNVSVGFSELSVGYVGFSDGYQLLKKNKVLTKYTTADNGNVAGIGMINLPKKKGRYKFYTTYKFQKNKIEKKHISYSDSFLKNEKYIYQKNWQNYFESLKPIASTKDKSLYYRSMYVLRTHEDKLNPGAMIASLSVPWGEEMVHEQDNEYGGYHLIWPRDLFHVSIAALYSGDKELALRALRFLKSIQYKSGEWDYGERKINKNGAFPQNVWANGEEYWGGFQLDQVAYPVHLFWHLYKNGDKKEKLELFSEFSSMAKDALSFIARHGPWSGQERWEENFGISPSSFAAAASALLIGEKIFLTPRYKEIAHQWLYTPNDNIHSWTFTTNGFYGDGNYYLRVAGCEETIAPWRPNANQSCVIANSWDIADQKEILDQGFLKLSLFGLVSPLDWRIKTSFNKIKNNLRVLTPKGFGHYRYSFDAYGENQKGRLWPLLNGEQARFYIEQASNLDSVNNKTLIEEAKALKETFHQFKNRGSLIPEQIFESSGLGTGGATPLAWSHAEYIKLMWSLEGMTNIANPFNL